MQEGFVGVVKKGNEINTKNGKMTFVSCSAPFTNKEGKRVYRACRLENKTAHAKKEAMRQLGMTGKQFQKYAQMMRRKEKAMAAIKQEEAK